MNNNNGCGFAILVSAMIVMFLLTCAFALSSIGIAPVIDSNGLSWDNSAYIAQQQSDTTRYVAKLQADVATSADNNATWRTIAIVGAVFGVVALVIAQWGITRRERYRAELKLRMYLAYIGVNGHVGKLDGELGVFDHDHGEFIPAGVALLEMRDN